MDIAIRILEELTKLNALHIILRVINSNNIYVSPKNGKVFFVDVMAAITENTKDPVAWGFRIPEDHYAYMSPEQTGRIKKAADYRTDFYSLGICLFELFTGDVPFLCNNILEFFNSHVAKQMPLASKVNRRVPEPVSLIIQKMCRKNPEDRYISAWGIREDLKHCRQLLDAGESLDGFTLGAADVSDKLIFQDRVYGRENEISMLKMEIEQYLSSPSTRLILIEGQSGVGKSTLVEKLKHDVPQEQCFF